jgi:threonine dehydrogenase-like Zn-dependent dehydrogenase
LIQVLPSITTAPCSLAPTPRATGDHRAAPSRIVLPYHPGHEGVGVVEQVTDGGTTVHPGDRGTVEPHLPCWDCKMYRTGRENLCENLVFFGCGYEQGGMAESSPSR